jgi:hypothetical protein
MSHEKGPLKGQSKKAAAKSLKEKRAAKREKHEKMMHEGS